MFVELAKLICKWYFPSLHLFFILLLSFAPSLLPLTSASRDQTRSAPMLFLKSWNEHKSDFKKRFPSLPGVAPACSSAALRLREFQGFCSWVNLAFEAFDFLLISGQRVFFRSVLRFELCCLCLWNERSVIPLPPLPPAPMHTKKSLSLWIEWTRITWIRSDVSVRVKACGRAERFLLG